MSGPASNDVVHPVPRTELTTGRVLEFTFPGLEVGVAEYDEGPTGCTVFHLPKVASLSIDVRGGSPGVNGQHLDAINAICFAGGSLYGLEASTGVAAELFKLRGYSTQWVDIALVSGAIIFDYGTRPNAIYPDKELGRAAVRAMRSGIFPMGPRGAGRSATASHGTGAELAGQGVAVLMISSELPEVLGMADRVVVLFEGRVMREFARAEADEDAIMRAATGIVEEAA